MNFGSIALFLALAFSFRAGTCTDLYFIAAASLFFNEKWGKKGFFITLISLFISSFLMHFFGNVDHFFRSGIEVIFASSFLIHHLCWLEACEEEKKKTHFLSTQKIRGLQLEEEIVSLQEEHAKEKISHIEKIELYQRLLDELESEKGAIEILNDVVRKNQAASFLKEKQLEKEVAEKEKNIEYLQTLLEKKEHELLDLIGSLENSFLKEVEIEEEEEDEAARLQELVTHLFKELSKPHPSQTLREAFSSKKKVLQGASLEQTLRESLTVKRKKK